MGIRVEERNQEEIEAKINEIEETKINNKGYDYKRRKISST